MGEEASSALGESLAPTPSQSPLGCASGVSVATVLVVLGRSAQRGEEKRFLLGPKARGPLWPSVRFPPMLFPPLCCPHQPFQALGAGGVNPTPALVP